MTAMSDEDPFEALARPITKAEPKPEREPFFFRGPGLLIIAVSIFVMIGTFAWQPWVIVPELVVAFIVARIASEVHAHATLSSAEYADRAQSLSHGEVNPQVRCPHCDTAGHVRVQYVKTKQGISGGKATGAILTGGASLWVTGLSRKGYVTRMHCGNCTVNWSIAG